MVYAKADFVAFPLDAGRVIANLESAYAQLTDAIKQRDALPVTMFWQAKAETDYLAVKLTSSDPGTTVGPRSAATEQRLNDFKALKYDLKAKIEATNLLIAERAQQYRSLRLPVLPDRQGEILRELDRRGLLGNDLLVVGTNAFAAYEFVCGARFPVAMRRPKTSISRGAAAPAFLWLGRRRCSLKENGRRCLPYSGAPTPASRSIAKSPTRPSIGRAMRWRCWRHPARTHCRVMRNLIPWRR